MREAPDLAGGVGVVEKRRVDGGEMGTEGRMLN